MNRQVLILVLAAALALAGGLFWNLSKHSAAIAPPTPTITAPVLTAKTNPAAATAAVQSGADLLTASLRLIEEETDELKREELLLRLVNEIHSKDIEATLNFLAASNPSITSRELQRRLLRRWALDSPKDAAEWIAKKPIGEDRQQALAGVATVWGEQDFSAAVAWARTLPDEEKNLSLVKIAYAGVEKNPLKALELVRELPGTESRDELLNHITLNWAAKSPEEASKWAAQITDTALHDRVISGIASAWGDTDPAAAATLALSSLPPGRNQDDAVIGIVQRWVQNKPADAGAWVVNFPEGPLRQNATEALVRLWADKDVAQTGDWINTLPEGPSRDHAVSAYVGKVATTNPESAALWASNIANEGQRFLYMEKIAETWLASDPAAARSWISNSTLPDTSKEKLLGVKPAN